MLARCVRRQVNTSYDVALWDVVRQHGHRAFVFLISRIFDFRKRCNFRECRSRSPRPIVKTEKSNFSELFSHQWGREWREGWRGQGWRGGGRRGELQSIPSTQILRYKTFSRMLFAKNVLRVRRIQWTYEQQQFWCFFFMWFQRYYNFILCHSDNLNAPGGHLNSW